MVKLFVYVYSSSNSTIYIEGLWNCSNVSTVHLASFCIYPKWFVSALYIGNSMHTGNSIILGFVELFKCVCVNVFMLWALVYKCVVLRKSFCYVKGCVYKCCVSVCKPYMYASGAVWSVYVHMKFLSISEVHVCNVSTICYGISVCSVWDSTSLSYIVSVCILEPFDAREWV